MNYYLVDDTRSNIRRVKEAIDKINDESKFYFINESGICKSEMADLPAVSYKFKDPITAEFIENIVQYISDNSIFLIDLSLNKTENDAAYKYRHNEPGADFIASIASQIIKSLKEHNRDTNIKVVSRLWDETKIDAYKWQTPLRNILGEPWFGTIHFVPTISVLIAHKSAYSLKLLNE